jgi:putative sterol carrier protein
VPSFPSPEWLEAYQEAINKSKEFHDAAGSWEGDVTYVIEADPEKGVMHDALGWFDLWHGGCRQARPVSVDDGERARYLIRAPYSVWKEVLQGRLEPLKGMTQGLLRLSGDLPTLRENSRAVQVLVSIAGKIPTSFPDES